MRFKFEKLIAWQEAMDFNEAIYLLVKEHFPKEELFILSSQIKRAADSIPLNVAEGCTGQSNPEFKRFLGYAIRSAIEVVSCLYIAKRRQFISNEKFSCLYAEAETLIKVITGLRNSL
jgi:four helix bundle protein